MFNTTIHKLSNGLVLIGEEMDWCESVSYTMQIPCGSVYDPPGLAGLANLTCEMLLRGAGERDSRSFTQAIENLGSEWSESVSHADTTFESQSLPGNLFSSLELLVDLIRSPHLPEKELGAAKQVVIQEIIATEDDPVEKLMIQQALNFFPDPWGRPNSGEIQSVKRITIDDIKQFHKRYYQPDGAVLCVVGKFNFDALVQKIETLLGDWEPNPCPPVIEKQRGKQFVHIPFDSNQTHIGITYPAVPYRHKDYFLAWSGVEVLSGGLSGRLFTELRDKRGLCYSVSASYLSLKDYGCVFCYCGTIAAKAKNSYELLLEELRKLQDGVTDDELRRLKFSSKCALVMQRESTASRCGNFAADWYHLGRVRPEEEIDRTISELTTERINTYLQKHPAGPFHVVVLGPEDFSTSAGSAG
ncbi:MAG: M16 family metallopeptidase [Thermoguttaceae bacterium]